MVQSRFGRLQNLAKNSNATEKRKASHRVPPFWGTFLDPVLERGIFCSDGHAFLSGPVLGSVLGSVLTPILDRKVFENKAEDTREREES